VPLLPLSVRKLPFRNGSDMCVLKFSEAARENGASRVLCGIHFSTAVNAGYMQGQQMGEWVYEHALRPANPRPAITASPVSERATH
jgi:hypothetical protein